MHSLSGKFRTGAIGYIHSGNEDGAGKRRINYRRLGCSGLKVSEICLGAWIDFGRRPGDDETFAILDAVEEGIDFFDTADVFASGKAEELTEIETTLTGKKKEE